jgi:hypothetical protein
MKNRKSNPRPLPQPLEKIANAASAPGKFNALIS